MTADALSPEDRAEIEESLRRLADEYREQQAAVDATNARRVALIRYAVERGLRGTEVAELAGVTKGRVSQILRRAEA